MSSSSSSVESSAMQVTASDQETSDFFRLTAWSKRESKRTKQVYYWNEELQAASYIEPGYKTSLNPMVEQMRSIMVQELRDGLKDICRQVAKQAPPKEAFNRWMYTQLCFAHDCTVAMDPLIRQPFAKLPIHALKAELRRIAKEEEVTAIVGKFQEICNKKLQDFRGFQLFMESMKCEVKMDASNGTVTLFGNGQAVDCVTISPARLQQLVKHSPKASERQIYTLLRRYATLTKDASDKDGSEGRGFQAAVPPAAMDVLRKDLHVEAELFASPLNAHMASFYSAFLDTDASFGSLGSIFNLRRLYGVFECNPPFVLEVMDRLADFLLFHLQQSEHDEGFVRFFVVVPDWRDPVPHYIDALKRCKFDMGRIYLPKRRHLYLSGRQHEEARPELFPAAHDTLCIWLEAGRCPLGLEVKDANATLRALTAAFDSRV